MALSCVQATINSVPLLRASVIALASRSVSSRQSDVDTSHGVVMPHALASFLPSMSIVPPQLHTMTLPLKRLDIFGTSISIRLFTQCFQRSEYNVKGKADRKID